ncbi:MAG TPA: hypothetical protein PLA85_06130 [Micropepsaceae bacterium]|nr:hypothetical protein [Micropepsaceae bacterium]
MARSRAMHVWGIVTPLAITRCGAGAVHKGSGPARKSYFSPPLTSSSDAMGTIVTIA